MSFDIGHILNDWPYEPGQVTARRIRGDDGRDKIQLRLDLGILQMEAAGRPDGERPHGHDSLLAYYEQQLQRHRDGHDTDKGFELDERACELLRAEAVMYYHRYLAEFVLEDFKAVERDTMRNLRLFDFCSAHAKEESDRYILEQYRPYVLMMCARARGRAALRDKRPKAALKAVSQGIQTISDFPCLFTKTTHLCDAAGVIGDGTIGINRHGDPDSGKHPYSRYADSIQPGKCVSKDNSNGNEDYRGHGTLHPYGKTGNNVRGRSCFGCINNAHYGIAAGVVLGNQTDECPGNTSG